MEEAGSSREFGGVDKLDAGGRECLVHLRNGAVEVDGATGIAHNYGLEAQALCVERRVSHAKIVSQPAEEDPHEASFAQIASQAGGRGAVIFEEGGVGIDFGTETFTQNQLGLRKMQGRMKLRAWSALNAMIGPQRLRAIGHFDLLEGTLAGMRLGEGSMARAVPILGKDDVSEQGREGMNDGNNLVAAWDGERSAGAEVALDVEDQQDVMGSNSHLGFRSCSETMRRRLFGKRNL